jgi:hypothetical protein
MNALARIVVLTGLTCSMAAVSAQGQDKLPPVAERAKVVWETVNATPHALAANEHIAIVMNKSQEKKAAEFLATAEKYRQAATKACGYAKEAPWQDPLVVLVLPGKDEFGTYVRRVQKRMLETGETTSWSMDDNQLHAGMFLKGGKTMAPSDAQVGELVAACVAARRIGVKNPSPDWIADGFGRATTHKLAMPTHRQFLLSEKRRANQACRNLAVSPWNDSAAGEDGAAGRDSLMYLLAYGPPAEKFPAFLTSFRPDENQESVPVESALSKAGITPATLWPTWKSWAAGWR